MIKKIFSIFFVVFLCCLAFSVNARYVRKYVKPNFFVPENIFNKPEKLPPLQRNNDDKSVKKISRSDIIQENEYNNINITNKYTIPSYQKQFDEYCNDIDYINKYKAIPLNKNLEKDLDDMNSDNLFRFSQKNNYEQSKVSSEFDKILKKVTN